MHKYIAAFDYFQKNYLHPLTSCRVRIFIIHFDFIFEIFFIPANE